MGTVRLAELYKLAGYDEKYVDRVKGCSTWMEFWQLEERLKLKGANFCHARLCPICTARAAVARAKLLSRVMDAVQVEHGCQYLFLTFTVKSVPGDKLGDEISHLTQSWNRLMNHRAVEKAVKGWFRALEITRNGKMYCPHIHAIIAVEDAYFAKKSKLWISRNDWIDRWKMALRVDYRPSVDIGVADDSKGGKRAVLEAWKYVGKDGDYISDRMSNARAAQIVADYTKAVYHRRLAAFGGWMKEMAKRLQADDLDHVDLEQGDENTIREDLAEYVVTYGWHFGAGDYVLAKTEVNPLRIKKEGGVDAGK